MGYAECRSAASAEDKPPPRETSTFDVARKVAGNLVASNLWRREGEGAIHRISPRPLTLHPAQLRFIEELGHAVWSFYKALNHLWLWKGNDWAKEWLNQGKPAWLLDLARMHYSKQHLPHLLRPDLIFSDDRMWVTELDSVPGGAGFTAAMARTYQDNGHTVIGGPDGITKGFAAVIDELSGRPDWTMAIVVSEESEDYLAEMAYLASELRVLGKNAYCVHPRDVLFDEEGLWLDQEDARAKIDVLWRFFELFDLRNIPKSELVIYASKKRKVIVSPPYKPHLEEKMALGLLHHEALAEFWEQQMGEWFAFLKKAVPKTFVLDPSPVPLHAEISGLAFRGRAVRDYAELADASQKERRLVVKPSGYSPLAWGARGVVVGHDVSQERWSQTLSEALASFHHTPHILQEFHEGARLEIDYFDPADGATGAMMGRARLSPYYYVTGDRAILAGVLATVCPADKKLIHGMTDAVMTVCAEGSTDDVQDG